MTGAKLSSGAKQPNFAQLVPEHLQYPQEGLSHDRFCYALPRERGAKEREKYNMPTIRLETYIDASPERCFDLSLSIDVHSHSVAHIHERPIAGVTSGVMQLGDTVT